MPHLTLPRREVTHAQKLAVTYTAHPMEPECTRILWWSIQMSAQSTDLNSLLPSPLLVLVNGTSKKTFLTIKPTRCINFSELFLEENSTCFGQFLRPSSGVFHCTHSSGICHTGLQQTAVEQDQDVPS